MTRICLMSGAAIVALAGCAPAFAQEGGEPICRYGDVPVEEGGVATCLQERTIVVSASRNEEVLLDNYTGSATIITAEQLEDRQTRDIADVLRDVPGVAVSSVAGQTQVRLRGSEANHVLVLVDGIEASDPYAGEFELGTLQAEIGSRVEVLRGPQSALYGSDAIGGVIAYNSGVFDGVAARLEGGTNNTLNGSARLGRIGEGWDASLSATFVGTDGEPNARGGTRDIGRDSYTLSGKGAVEVANGVSLRAAGRFSHTEGEFNDQDFDTTSPTFGFTIDTPDTRFEIEAIYGLLGISAETMGGDWTHDLSAQIGDFSRDTFGPFGRSNSSEGDRVKASYVSAYTLSDRHTLTFAADYEVEGFRNTTPGGFSFDQRREIETIGLVAEYRYIGERFDASAAVRHDVNDLFADATTFKLGAGFDLTETTRLRASAGSGIKNPGFFELYGFSDGRFIGNPDLRPEKSTSWEVGVDQDFADRAARLSVTYFNATLDGEIFTTYPAPDFIATPVNAGTESEQQGIEVAVNAQVGPQWSLNAAYTWLDAEENGVTEIRRPESIASAAVTWTAPHDAASATLVVRHNGEAIDNAFTDPSFVPVRVTLDDYTLVNLNARVRLAEGLDLFARADNLLDERYEQVFSFVSPGRQVVAGFRATF